MPIESNQKSYKFMDFLVLPAVISWLPKLALSHQNLSRDKLNYLCEVIDLVSKR